jgi:hypothetical protein
LGRDLGWLGGAKGTAAMEAGEGDVRGTKWILGDENGDRIRHARGSEFSENGGKIWERKRRQIFFSFLDFFYLLIFYQNISVRVSGSRNWIWMGYKWIYAVIGLDLGEMKNGPD